MFQKIFRQLNIPAQCRGYGLSLWQCPQFLFLVMGIIIIIASLIFYLIGTYYVVDPEIVALAVLVVATILFIISFIIIRSFERLAEASRMKSEFVDIVSHQMRAPLTNLKWVFEFLTPGKTTEITSEKREEYFNSAKENIERMVELIDDLLIVSKIEQGEFPLRRKEIFLEKLITGLVSRFKFFAEASNIELKFYPPKNLPKIFVDPSHIKLVIENLIDNAIRYTKSRGKVEIRLQKKGKNLFFQIQDTGAGIPERDQKYIFQKFFRAENILKEQTRGSGLGLYIAKSIIEKLGGKIWFDSEEGQGTTFYFTLPIK